MCVRVKMFTRCWRLENVCECFIISYYIYIVIIYMHHIYIVSLCLT